uniref:Nbs-lrr resistance protein n=1 Tax=Solanum tuberosum TaxID=4113 RepID=M1ARU0_SOLTU
MLYTILTRLKWGITATTCGLLSCHVQITHLEIRDCPLLEALSDGLGKLASLEKLCLRSCEKLEHLPSRDAMRRLTKLRNLEIGGCPKLKESCTNRSIPKLPVVQHFPYSKN